MIDDENPCDPCVAAALLEVAAVRDNLHRVLWAERSPVAGIDRAISDLFRARRMLRAAGVES